jgi:hypothetical protein
VFRKHNCSETYVLESANLQPNLYDFLEGAVIDVAL